MPALPEIRLAVIAQHTVGDGTGFLRVVRRTLQAAYPGGEQSQPFAYDEVQRRALDAVVLLAHFNAGGERQVFLRSAVRPPLEFRRQYLSSLGPATAGLWELPAGLVEPDEESEAGLVSCAQRELQEELGFRVQVSQLRPLGGSTFPCPGVLAERHFFFEVEVDPQTRHEPSLDGSALEQGGVVVAVSLQQALTWCNDGTLEDAKTELGLRRLAELKR